MCMDCMRHQQGRCAVSQLLFWLVIWLLTMLYQIHRLSSVWSMIKVKLSLCFLLAEHQAMKAYRGNGGIAPRLLDLGTKWRWLISFTPRPLYHQGKIPYYPLGRSLDGPQSRSERGGEEKNSQPLLAQFHTHKTTDKIIVLYILVFTILI